jgi:acyl-CoA synthetase (AMP-forming)/AMP-acid ligase II
MTALAAATTLYADLAPPDEAGWGAMRLSGLLAANAERNGRRLAFKDQSDRENWSGRPALEWAYPVAHRLTQRLSTFFRRLRLPANAPIGICLPNGSEACLAILAIEEAGLTPCLLPVSWSEQDLADAIESAQVAVVITQGVVGEERPADLFCRLAARYFGLRFVCAFGPHVPDGVVDLDRVILEFEPPPKIDARPTTADAAGASGIVTFSRRNGVPQPVFRPSASVMAAAASFLVAAKIEPGERVLSLLAPDDHRSLTTGLVASLVSGATLECHGLFSGRTFLTALTDRTPTHIVAPGWMEPALAAADLPASVASVVLVHEAPTRFRAKTTLQRPIIDVLAFGELALIAGARKPSGQFSLKLEEDTVASDSTAQHLLRVRRDEDGRLHFSGPAAQVQEVERGSPVGSNAESEWRASGFRAELFAGILIGVS